MKSYRNFSGRTNYSSFIVCAHFHTWYTWDVQYLLCQISLDVDHSLYINGVLKMATWSKPGVVFDWGMDGWQHTMAKTIIIEIWHTVAMQEVGMEVFHAANKRSILLFQLFHYSKCVQNNVRQSWNITPALFICWMHSIFVKAMRSIPTTAAVWWPNFTSENWRHAFFKAIMKLYYHCYVFIFTNQWKCLL